MMIDAISAVGSAAIRPDSVAATAQAPALRNFENWLGDIDQKVTNANQAVRDLALGDAESLHGTMIAIESARLSVDLFIQVRNRVVDAYQELMRMQI